jgi:hypothetical protein
MTVEIFIPTSLTSSHYILQIIVITITTTTTIIIIISFDSPNKLCVRDVTINFRELEFFFCFSNGVRLSPPGTAATVWPIVRAQDDR